MKKLLTTLTLVSLLFLIGCSYMPTIDEVQEATEKGVEELLTEDNNEKLSVRMDRYFLSEQVDDLTYKGSLKATAFFPIPKRNRNKLVEVTDSLKFYRTVIIKFRDKKYEQYTISIEKDE